MFPFAIRLIRGAVVLLVLLVLASAALPLRPGPESAPLRAQFTADPMIGYAPLDVVLDATDDIPTDFYGWEIDWDGDGMVDDEGNDEPVYAVTYEEPGRYYPMFTFLNNDYGVITRVTTEVIVNNPEADDDGGIYGGTDPGYGAPSYQATLTADPASGEAPLMVFFTAEGVDDDYYYYWELDYDGDGTADEEGDDEPEGEYEYTAAGTYYPQITYFNDDYGVVTQAQTTVMVTAPAGGEDIGTPGLSGVLAITLIADPEAGDAPLPVEFEVDGIDEDEYSSWSFDVDGDGAADMDDYGEFAAAITYGQPGTYYPAVALFNDDGGLVAVGNCEVDVYVNAEAEMLDPDETYLMPGQLTDTLAPEKFEPVLTALPDYGLAPLNVNFAVSGVEIDDYAYWELDWDGDGQYDGGDKGAVIWLVTYDTPGQYYPTVWFYDDNQQLLGEATTEVQIADPDQAQLINDWFPFDGDPEYLAKKWEPRVANVKQLTLTATPSKGETPFEPEFSVGKVDFVYWLWELDWDNNGSADRASQTWDGKVKGYYDKPGTYAAALTFYNGSNQVIAEGFTTVEVTGEEIIHPTDGPRNAVKLKAFPESGHAPLTVRFDARDIEPKNWDYWGFDQGDGITRYPAGRPVIEATYDYAGKFRAQILFYDAADRVLEHGVAEIQVLPGSGTNKHPTRGVVADLRAEYFPGNPSPWTVKWSANNSYPLADIKRFRWDADGDGGYEFDLSDKYNHTSTYTRPGRYTARLEVTDKNGNVDRAERTIVLGEAYADLNVYPASGRTPLTVLCDASGSWAASGISLYKWKFVEEKDLAKDDDDYYGITTKEPTKYHTFDKPGKYVVILATACGSYGAKNLPKAYATIEVGNSGKAPTASIFVSGLGGPIPYKVEFNTGNSSDSDGRLLCYIWDADINDGIPPVTQSSGSGAHYEYTYMTAGVHEAALVVIDDEDLPSNHATVKIHTWQSSLSNLTAKLKATPVTGMSPLKVSFDANSSTYPTGRISTFTLQPDITNPSQTLNSFDGKFEHTYKQAGFYTARLTITAKDAGGHAIESSDSIEIQVKPSPTEPVVPGGPVAVVSHYGSSGASSRYVTIDANNSYVLTDKKTQDTKHRVVKLYFDPNHRDSRPGTMTNSLVYSHTYGTKGTYFAEVYVIDDLGRKSQPVIIEIEIK